MTWRLRSEELSWRQLEGETVVLDLRTSRYFRLNRSSSVLWGRLVDGASRDDLVGALVDEFGIDDEQALADVDAFIARLTERGLLT